MNEENKNEEKENDKESLLLRFKNFIRRNSIRIKAGAAATIVAGSIGYAAWNLNSNNNENILEPTTSQEVVDPTYNPEESEEFGITTPSETPTETTKPSGEEDSIRKDDEDKTHTTNEDNNDNESTNQNGSNTNPNETNTNPNGTNTNPGETTGEENTEKEVHTHQFGEWKAVDEETEERQCSCGAAEKRGHKFNEPAITYETTDGNIHLVTTIKECKTCDLGIVTKGYEDCNYTLTFDKDFEYLTCNDCGKELKRLHVFDNGTNNGDGTTSYQCTNEGCQYVKTIQNSKPTPSDEDLHSHKYGEATISYLNLGEEGHLKVFTQTCSEEGCPNPVIEIKDEKATAHNFGEAVNSIDKKTGKPIEIYTCKDCGYEKIVEKTQGPVDPVHTHNYNGTPKTTYENINDKTHTKVLTYTCSDGECPRPDEVNIVKTTVNHNFDMENGVLSEDGKSMIYSCECGKTLTKEITNPPVQHTHNYNGDPVITWITSESGHKMVKTYTCTDPNCPNNKEPFVDTDKTISNHNFGAESEVTEGDVTYIQKTCSDCNFVSKVVKEEQETPKDPIRIDVESLITIDPATLEFEYDGDSHFPDITGIPEELNPRFVSTAGTNAGEYVWRIEFDPPEGYVADPIEISYKVNPITVSIDYEYDQTTGAVEAIYKGVLTKDIVNTNYTINGETIDPNDLSSLESGLHRIESNIKLDSEKAANYIFPEDLTETSLCEVKNENQWYKIQTEYEEEDGVITISVYLADNKVPYYSDLVIQALTFKVLFDENALEFVDSTTNEDYWAGEVYIDPDKNPDAEDGSFISLDEEGEPVKEPVKVCDMTFTYKEGHENDKDLTIQITDSLIGTGHWEYDFGFTTDTNTIVLNPTGGKVNTIIKKGNDPMKDAIYTYEGMEGYEEDEEAAREMLRKYIEDGYEVPDDLKYMFGDELDEESDAIEISEVSESAETEELGEEENLDENNQGEESDSSEVEDNGSDNTDGTQVNENQEDALGDELLEAYLAGEEAKEQTENENDSPKVYTLTYNNDNNE